MRKLYILFFLVLFSLQVHQSNATVWTVTTNGFSFSPLTLTISLGDTVTFAIASMHNAVEVSQATWNSNGSTSNGGFMIPFGGGTLIPTQAQTYYYVCQPHAGGGMKGQIVVNNTSGIGTPVAADGILKFQPNPASTQTKIHTGLPDGITAQFNVYDVTGKLVYSKNEIMNNYIFDVAILNKGIYFAEIRSEGYTRTTKLVVEN